jgi:hypothetical protein
LPFLLGVLGFVVGLQRAGVVSLSMLVALVAVLIVPMVFTAMLVLPWYALRQSGIDLLVVFLPLAALYLLVGFRLLRGFPRPAVP